MKFETKRFLIRYARGVIEMFVKNGDVLDLPKNCPEELKEKKGVFVTLFKKEKAREKEVLRGCIGLPYPQQSIIKNLRDASISATQDPRFEELREDELEDIIIEISILSEPKRIDTKPEKYLDKIEPHKDGLIIKRDIRSGLLLPQVWEDLPDKIEFLSHLCLKAGLLLNEWMREGTTLYKFQVERIREDELES